MQHQEKKFRLDSLDELEKRLVTFGAKQISAADTTHFYAQQNGHDVLKLVVWQDKSEIHALAESKGKFSLTQKIPVKNQVSGIQKLKEMGVQSVARVGMTHKDYAYKDGIVGLYAINDFLNSAILDFPPGQHEKIQYELGLKKTDIIDVPYDKYLKKLGRLETLPLPYKISKGLDEAKLEGWLKDALKKYGIYQGTAINYTHADIAPAVMCTILYADEILLLKRADNLADANGYWSTCNGFIDEIRPVQEIAQKELKEELSLDVPAENIKVATSYTLENPAAKRAYIVFPCLIKLNEKPEIVLDEEHTEFRWIARNDLERFEILDDLPHAIDTALATDL